MTQDLKDWRPCPRPERKVMEGVYVRLEPLDRARHGDGLYEASAVADAGRRFAWLYEDPPGDRASFLRWVAYASAKEDPLYFAVIDKASGKAGGRQTLMRIDAANGCVEIGHIYWGPLVSRRPGASEALFLFAAYVFDELGYRRFEWKCDNDNEPSKRAALRFGFTFEGQFRQHMVIKGANRDTAWFAMIDGEWPALRRAYQAWLEPSNFDAAGNQKRRLEDLRRELRV